MTALPPRPYRRDDDGRRLCDCDSGPCERVAEDGGKCEPCVRYCALREASGG